MRPIACSQIRRFSQEFTNPSRAYWLMKDFMDTAIKLTKDTVTKDLILKFNRAKIGFKEEEDIANRVTFKMKSKSRSGKENYEIIRNLMKHKTNDAMKCVKESKSKLEKTKRNLNQVVRKGTLVRDMFMEEVDNEIGNIWKTGKLKNEQKLKFSINKRKKSTSKTVEIDEVFKGVIVGDKKLEDLESENIEKNEQNNQARIYSNIVVEEKQKEILLLLLIIKHILN